MSDRERFNRQMSYQGFDRCFNTEMGYWEENYKEWDIFSSNGITNAAQARVLFSFDRIRTVGVYSHLIPPIKEQEIGIKDGKRVIINGEGLMAEVSLTGSSIPHFLKSSITTPDDWKKMKEEHFDLRHPGRIINIDAVKRKLADELNPFERVIDVYGVMDSGSGRVPAESERDYPLGVYCGSMIGKVRDILTVEGLAYAAYDYPDMVEDMVETMCQCTENALDQLLPNFEFDFASGWEDICFNHGPLVSLDFFKNVVVPRYKRISKKLRARNINLWYTDCDGDLRPVIPLLLEGGINCLYPFEVKSCVHPGVILDEYGKDLHIIGGVDKMKLAEGPEAIKTYLESLEKYVARGGFIPFCDHYCPPNVSPQNYLYYLDLKERMFGNG
jgi:uroporphyrinogen decarboxylase